MDLKFISYEGLPIKSGGAHKLTNISGSKAYHLLLNFVEKLTNNPYPHCTLELDLSHKQELKANMWYMIRNFGLPIWSQSHYLSNRNLVWIFSVRKRQIDKAFNISDRFSNVTVSAMWRFKFISPQTGIVLFGQDDIPVVDDRLHNSQIYLRFAQHVTVSLWLTLPFSDLNYDAVNYIKLLKDSLPFKISDNNWKIWKFTEGRLTARKLNIAIVDVE